MPDNKEQETPKEEQKEEVEEGLPKNTTETGTVGEADVKDDSDKVKGLEAQVKELTELVRATADKGRVLAYEQRKGKGKGTISVKLSNYAGGIIVGWQTLKDKLVQHPTTGKVVGEEQEYELKILKPDGKTDTATVSGYPNFSEARYGDQNECQVIGKSEDYNGVLTFKVQLPDGRTVDIDGKFVN